MESRHHDRFDLRKHAREIVLLLLRDTNHEVSLHDISKSLKFDTVLVKMEIAIQADNYPAIEYDTCKEALTLSETSLPLMCIIRDVLGKLKGSFYASGRFEGIIYELGIKSQDTMDFWDKIQSLIFASDPLSSFLLNHFLGIAVTRFGPLGSSYIDDAVTWRTAIPSYENEDSPIVIDLSNAKLQTCLSFIRRNPVFVKAHLAHFSIDREIILLLESLGIISYDHERQWYHTQLPSIYPWNLNPHVVSFLMQDDYCRRVYRDLRLEMDNPMPAIQTPELLLELVKAQKKDVEGLDLGTIETFNDFSNNVISVSYREDQKSKFSIKTMFPISLQNSEAFGEILWALERAPKVIELMPFDWLKTTIKKAIETTRLLGVTTEIHLVPQDSTIFFTSRSTAKSISLLAHSFGLMPRMEYVEYGGTLRFPVRDMMRVGLVIQKDLVEKQETQKQLVSPRGIAYELLNEVLRIRPEQTMTLEELASRLELDLDFLRDFITTHFDRSLDLGVPGQIAPLGDPWLKIPI